MTIALIGWARLPHGAAEGGGLNQVVTQLARALVARGHRVLYIRSGLDYSLGGAMHLKQESAWQGVACFTLLNSPNLSIGSCNFENVREQIASPEHSRLLAGFLVEHRVDVLNIHAFEGIAFDLVREVKHAGIPVVVTPHNYVALCPQIDLLHQERRVCDDYEGGTRCVGCLRPPDFRWEKRRRARVHTARRLLGDTIYDAIKPFGRSAANALARLLPRATSRRAFENPAPTNARGDDFAEHLAPGTPLAHERLLHDRDVHLSVLNDYGKRRRAGVDALNHADAILAPGRFLARVHEAMSVTPSKLRHVPLGLAHIDDLRAQAQAAPDFDTPAWRPADTRPLRLVYFGNCWVNKGLAILVEALALLHSTPTGQATLARCTLDAHASGDDRPFRERLRSFSNVHFHGSFTQEGQASALARADVGIFPGLALENSPLVIMEVLAAGRFVVASRRGAMEEFINEGTGGTLFNPGDPAALARTIEAIVSGAIAIPTRRVVQQSLPQRTLGEYVDEMEQVDHEVRGTPDTPTSR